MNSRKQVIGDSACRINRLSNMRDSACRIVRALWKVYNRVDSESEQKKIQSLINRGNRIITYVNNKV